MNINTILSQIVAALGLKKTEVTEAFHLADFEISPHRITSILSEEGSRDYKPCTYEELGAFLDGLVLLKRGPSPKRQDNSTPIALTNNLILKKLRIALELKDPETEIIFALGDAMLTKQELKSLFRSEKHKNFRTCSDTLLEAFLEGIEEFHYTGEAY